MGPIILITLAGLLAICAGIWQYVREHPAEIGTYITPGTLTAFAGLLVLIAGVLQYRDEIDDFKTTLANITGGDSFVYLLGAASDEEFREVDFTIRHNGNFTVYDVQISLNRVDATWNDVPMHGSPSHTEPPSRRFFNAISPAHPPMQYPDRIFAWHPQERSNAADESRFKVIITTRNNYFVQYIRLDNVGGAGIEWAQSSVLLEHGEMTKVVHAQGDKHLLDELGTL